MSNLLAELKKIKVTLPEEECFVPEWNRTVRLRGFTVGEGKRLREGERKAKDGSIADSDGFVYRTIAHSVVDGDERPLANKDGVALIESLSEATCRKMITAMNRLAGGEADSEKNSVATANGGISSESQDTSAAPLPN